MGKMTDKIMEYPTLIAQSLLPAHLMPMWAGRVNGVAGIGSKAF